MLSRQSHPSLKRHQVPFHRHTHISSARVSHENNNTESKDEKLDGFFKTIQFKRKKSEGIQSRKHVRSESRRHKNLSDVEVDDEVKTASTEIICNSTEMAHFSLYVTNVVLKSNQRLVTAYEEIVTTTEDPKNQPAHFPEKSILKKAGSDGIDDNFL